MTAKWTIFTAVCLIGIQTVAEDAPALATPKDKVSYSIGADIGRNLKRQGFDIDAATVLRGMKDGLSGDTFALTEEEMRTTLTTWQAEMVKKQDTTASAKGAENQKAGEAFLAKNKDEKDVVTLPSGLQYKILKAGDGKKPVDTDAVECHYKGTLIDGTEFDSSYRRGEPATFKVGQVIKGWQEALKLMPVGSKWQLFIPSDIAYGPRGAGRDIGPNATLIFEVELLAIK